MTDFQKIADKLGKRHSPCPASRERNEGCIDVEQLLFRYPAVATLCLMAICSAVVFFVAWTVLALLVVAWNT